MCGEKERRRERQRGTHRRCPSLSLFVCVTIICNAQNTQVLTVKPFNLWTLQLSPTTVRLFIFFGAVSDHTIRDSFLPLTFVPGPAEGSLNTVVDHKLSVFYYMFIQYLDNRKIDPTSYFSLFSMFLLE